MENFYDVANNLPTLSWIADADGSIFRYNRRWYQYRDGNLPRESARLGLDLGPRCGSAARCAEAMETFHRHGEPFEMTFPLKGNDGIFRPFLTRAVPLRDPAGIIVRWLGTNVDISAQVAAKSSLRESAALYRSALTAGRMGTWQTDLVSKTRLWTAEGMALFGSTFRMVAVMLEATQTNIGRRYTPMTAI